MELCDQVKQARERLTKLRSEEAGNKEVSIHLNAFEIALCLTEFSLHTRPARPISSEEEQWFEAGRHIDLLFGDSEWSDLTCLYFSIVAEVKRRNYFRP